MDNKNTALNQNVDLISTNGLDEMQREQAYKIAFNCFKVFYWGDIIIATALVLLAFCVEDITLSIIGIALTIFASAIYVSFAVKSTAKGSMNPDFAVKASTTGRIILMTVIGFAYTITSVSRYLDGEHITHLLSGIFMAIFYISHIITYFLAKKSIKIMNTETEEEE